MAAIAPTITAYDPHEYRKQVEQIQGFAKRLHIDLMDGVFTDSKSPDLEHIWWPHGLVADVHLMYRHPEHHLEKLVNLQPSLVVIHAEAEVNHMAFAAELHKENIKSGLALLQNTSVDSVERILHSFDHVLIFSGDLGKHGGVADLSLLDKVRRVQDLHPDAEIGWDGGINDQNLSELVSAGVDVLNVGGYIQKAPNPQGAYDKLIGVIKA